MRSRRSARPSLLVALPFLALPLLVLGVIWQPEIAHFSAPQAPIDGSTVESGRQQPDNGVLEELGSFSVLPVKGRTGDLEVSIADGILDGRLELPDLPDGAISPGFSADDLDRLPAALQLWYAGFAVPDFLLAAFAETGREEFFTAAESFIVAWDRYERGSWLPRGLLWNDHAISARVGVLAEFWRVYRSRPDYQPDVGRAILEQAARYGFFLSNPEHFTFSTNHGLMQNLGLLELSLAFPSLPDADRYHRIAIERLGGQLAFLIDDAGFIRENSAGYQAFDLHILGMAFRSMTLLGDRVPEAWSRRYVAGLDVLAHLLRPDGTLPVTGDTDGGALVDFPLVTEIDGAGQASALHPFDPPRPDQHLTLDAGAGYWIAWDGIEDAPEDAASQTVVTWTSPPSPAHKHADELSVLLWSDGVSWLTSVGYWPYEQAGRTTAESWDGANAPHLANEPTTSQRVTELLGFGTDAGLAAVDLERMGPGDYRVRRQVVRVGQDVWIVLDFVSGAGANGTRTVWTTASDVELRLLDRHGAYALVTPDASARIDLIGSPGNAYETYRGVTVPLLGWHVVDGTPQPAPAIVANQPADESWLAVVVSRSSDPSGVEQTGAPEVTTMSSPEDWALTVATRDGPLAVRRSGDAITATPADPAEAPAATVRLAAGPADPGADVARAAFASMATDYPAWRSLTSRRLTMTLLIPGLIVAQELTLLLAALWRPRAYWPLRALSVVAWLAVALWLGAVFLQPWEVITVG